MKLIVYQNDRPRKISAAGAWYLALLSSNKFKVFTKDTKKSYVLVDTRNSEFRFPSRIKPVIDSLRSQGLVQENEDREIVLVGNIQPPYVARIGEESSQKGVIAIDYMIDPQNSGAEYIWFNGLGYRVQYTTLNDDPCPQDRPENFPTGYTGLFHIESEAEQL